MHGTILLANCEIGHLIEITAELNRFPLLVFTETTQRCNSRYSLLPAHTNRRFSEMLVLTLLNLIIVFAL